MNHKEFVNCWKDVILAKSVTIIDVYMIAKPHFYVEHKGVNLSKLNIH